MKSPELLRPPELKPADLLKQFWVDIYGKEVQTASTYSYTWMADQLGHICFGILFDFLFTLIAGWVLVGFNATYRQGSITGMVLTIIAVSLWEFSAYRSSVKDATGIFTLDRRLLRNNAIVAAAYMAFGAAVGFAFHQLAIWAILISIAILVFVILLAPPWLRQKIIWQKAALPYLFRLADAAATIDTDDARTLQNLIDEAVPPNGEPQPVIIGGPIGSGRTSMATGIGTEFAFKGSKVRYVSFSSLLEFAAGAKPPTYPDDSGPKNISYWPWSEAQVVIIDDIGPLITTSRSSETNLQRFRELLDSELQSIREVIARCHSVWIIGDLGVATSTEVTGSTLDDFAKAIATYCKNQRPPLVIELATPESLQPQGSGILPEKRLQMKRIEVLASS